LANIVTLELIWMLHMRLVGTESETIEN